MSLEAHVRAAIEQGLLSEAARLLDREASLPLPLEVVRVQLEAQAGSVDDAEARAEVLMDRRLDAREAIACLDVIGRAQLRRGRPVDGLGRLHKALELAREHRDPVTEARVFAGMVDGLLRFAGIEAAASRLNSLRRLALSAGDARTLVAHHLLMAEIQTKRREFRNAGASLDSAAGLLRDAPNVIQAGTLALVRSAHASLRSDPAAAVSNARIAQECAERSGAMSLRIPALGTLAHALLAAGRFDECRATLADALALVRPGGVEIALHSTDLGLALAEGDMDRAGAIAAQTAHLSAALEEGHSYYGLWYALMRVRWLVALGQSREAADVALEAIPHIERTADRNLLDRMSLLGAEALGLAGRRAEGTALLAGTVLANPDPPLELVAEFARVAGRLIAAEAPADARSHFDRAIRIHAATGNVAERRGVERDAASLADHAPEPDLAAGLVESAAALLDLAPHPALLGRELLALCAGTSAIAGGALVEEDAQGARTVLARWPADADVAAIDAGTIAISLGITDGRRVDVRVAPAPSTRARVTLVALQRLVQGSLALAEARQREREPAAYWPDESAEQPLGFISATQNMADLIATTRRVAQGHVTVLITGETGVGKELLARALHQASPRRHRIFLPCNCTAVPREMLDSQLFGHRRGAFTGAHADFPGVIRAAEGGTLFLDEIGELGLDLQPKLLRFLESGEILPLGETRPQAVDVRIVTATNANLDRMVQDGRFREDLYYRLNVIRLEVPPLRERREEIPPLVEHFLDRFSREAQKARVRVSDETMEYLVLYRWPGNVRQLANEARRLVAFTDPGALATPAQLSPDIAASRRTIAVAPGEPAANTIPIRLDQPLTAAIEQVERAVIRQVLSSTNRNLAQAAEILGMSRKGLFLKRQRYQLD